MTAIAAGVQPLRYFIHDDFDAFRIEISGGLIGRSARAAYDAWRAARVLARRARLVVDISYVTQADEDGKAVLQAWRKQEAQIVASSPVSLAIADSIVRAPIHIPSVRRTVSERLSAFFCRPTAGNPARAESAPDPSAGSK